jgi:hypothetical protein
LETTLTEFEENSVAFWKAGLELWDESTPQRCPFCGENTLTKALIDERRGQIDQAQDSLESKKSLEKKVKACQDAVNEMSTTLGQLQLRSLSTQDREKLKAVFDHSQQVLQQYLLECEALESVTSTVLDRLGKYKQHIENLQQTALGTHPETLPELATQLVQDVNETILDSTEAFTAYEETFVEFEPVLRVELADEKEVEKYTAAIELLDMRESVQVCAANQELENDLLDCQRAVAEYVKQKQEQVLATREAEMLSWFGRLSPGSTTTFSGIEPATDRFILKADSFGAELSAPACLSHSQLNCLGLSIWIPSVTAPLSPFRFILFDDPVQALDDEPAQSFVMNTVPFLIEKEDIQVIVLTHLESSADRLRQELYHLQHRFYRFDSLSADGVRLNEYYPLRDEIRQIKRLKVSDNEESRELAVDRIRVLCEHIIREAYLHEHGKPMPEKYASATASVLLGPFDKLATVSPKQKQGLRSTVTWADPAHHTDKTWQVPSASNIEPHLSRVEKLATDLGLL